MNKMVFPMVMLACLCSSWGVGTPKPKKIHLLMEGPYETPQDVTRACLECHEDEAADFQHSRHWNWLGEPFEHEGKTIRLGKANLINNFCVAIASNEPRCTSCHAGYGWKDGNFDFSKQENMDCLVCHDQTGKYEKFPTDAGYPVFDQEEKLFKEKNKVFKKVDLLEIAQHVGAPRIENCGSCHFFGGGGHGVKPGDLDRSLIKATPEIDVHMGHADPAKRMNCASCHKVEDKHDIRGALHASMAANANHFHCTDCHTGPEVHQKRLKNTLNRHVLSLECGTCHITEVAKVHPTKTWWDWSTAGDKQRETGQDENGMALYDWKKGDFLWKKNLKPEYRWYDGSTGIYLMGEAIEDPSVPLVMNPPNGDYHNANAKIAPFKVMRGKQFYDQNTKQLLIPHLFGKGGYWDLVDWDRAFVDGMKSVGLEYSGSHGVVETEMYWPLHHMVSPAKQALRCGDCHPKDGVPSLMDWHALGYPGDPVKTNVNRITESVVRW
jgi:octaheme c-type cytochrome (tetrathionate reductase family)